jgi:hypothetical protein
MMHFLGSIFFLKYINFHFQNRARGGVYFRTKMSPLAASMKVRGAIACPFLKIGREKYF